MLQSFWFKPLLENTITHVWYYSFMTLMVIIIIPLQYIYNYTIHYNYWPKGSSCLPCVSISSTTAINWNRMETLMCVLLFSKQFTTYQHMLAMSLTNFHLVNTLSDLLHQGWILHYKSDMQLSQQYQISILHLHFQVCQGFHIK